MPKATDIGLAARLCCPRQSCLSLSCLPRNTNVTEILAQIKNQDGLKDQTAGTVHDNPARVGAISGRHHRRKLQRGTPKMNAQVRSGEDMRSPFVGSKG